MENLWIFYSLAGLLVLGLGDFVKKVVLQKGGNKEVFLFMCFIIYIIIFGGNYFLNSTTAITNFELKSALIIGSFDFLAPLGMLTALKYLDVSFSLVSIRLISSIFILAIGTSILGDNLSVYNIIGFIIGFIAIFLLSGFKFSGKLELHTKGILGAGGAIIGIIGGHSYFKYAIPDINIDNYTILKFLVTFGLLIIYMIIRKKFRDFSVKNIKLVLPFAFITGLLFVVQFLYLLPQIYLLGPLSLGYKILSYSLIIPIILSIIIYNEKVTKRKIIAFVLTLLSLALFII
ncbi:hypothetical protein LR004_00855 [Candidatus Gracilibacteria bacterium]|nr:hypothetical protein [Candidatus Gracilibacteria bacterium]